MGRRSRRLWGASQEVGDFRIVRPLGAGGMAETFEALQRGPNGFEQRVCLKRVRRGYERDAEFRRLFLREARLAAALSHPNIVGVLDYGEHFGCPYLALELVDGMDLRQLLKTLAPGRVPAEVAVFIALELAKALHHAHTRNGVTGPVVHRDLSPANVLLSLEGDVKLTDFGIAKAVNEQGHALTDVVRGNLWYMAPERLDNAGTVEPRADLYSLGVVLYELLAGTHPYSHPEKRSVLRSLVLGLRIPLLEAAPETPAELAEIVEHLLQQFPEERYPDAACVVAKLTAHLSSPAAARHALRELVRTHYATPMTPEDTGPVTLDLGRELPSRSSSLPLAATADSDLRPCQPHSSREPVHGAPHPGSAAASDLSAPAIPCTHAKAK